MEFNRCLRCMQVAQGYPCTHCGYDPAVAQGADYGLRPGVILNGKYVVGTILGQGGFGITYVGWDLALESKVAIKEYYPAGQVIRDNATGSLLHWLSTPQSETARNAGREMFLKEARKMSRVSGIPQVVRVRDLFQENDTAYIVMDFVEGQTLKESLRKTGPITWAQAERIFFPAIRAMEQVHREGLIHRDLSPDNLMLQPDGTVRILDLGAAKDLNVNSGASSMQVAKGGFSPLEQYTQRGGSGTWSDVYAMAATMYYSLTGILPPPVMDRMEEDQLRWDLEPLKALPGPALEAMKNAMILLPKNRTQTMGEFLAQLEKAQAKAAPKPAPKQKREKKKFPLPILAAVLAVVLIAGWVLLPGDAQEPRLESQPQAETQTEAVPEPETTVPTEPQSLFPLSIQEQTISDGPWHTAAIKEDGTAVAAGDSNFGQCWLLDWSDIVAISTGDYHTVGLKGNGTVVATGCNDNGQCDVSDWKDIISIGAGTSQTMGLKADGTVVATGDNTYGQCDVTHWKGIVSIKAGYRYAVGLKADGTVIATGYNDLGQCDVSDWEDIVDICAGTSHTVGLKVNGTVVTAGWNDDNQCDVSGWRDIIAISAGECHTVGLKADGTVVATIITNAINDFGQCDVSNWSDIVAISAGAYHTVGLKADGTILATGYNDDGRCEVSTWTDIRIPGTNP